MEMLTYFHRMSLNKNCGCMIFSVAHRYRKSMSIIERVIYIYIYIYHHIFAIPFVFIEIYRVGDNRRPVNSSTSLHISDKLGAENVWETLLCWFIVVLWVLVCKNMYRYERHFGSSHRYSSLRPLTAHVSDCAIELTEAGSRSGTKTSWLERILDINVRSLYRRIYYQLNTTSISDRLQRYVDKMASITTADNYTPFNPREPKQSFSVRFLRVTVNNTESRSKLRSILEAKMIN